MVWEERWHPLREEWVIIAAHRQHRPWIGETMDQEDGELPEYMKDCYLCPGNLRVSGQRNARYTQTYVFDNDHPCVGFNAPSELETPTGIYRSRPAHGIARIVCYSPKHNLTLTELEPLEIESLFRVWQEQYSELGNHPEVNHVLIFENKGETVGVPHPHCQIYATNFARYAYEVYVAPKATYPSLAELTGNELRDFTLVLKQTLVKFDNLWHVPFPYIMPLHQAPTDGGDYRGFHCHIEFHPPLHKPNLLKYLAGPEIGGGNFLSDTVPEEKASG